MTENTHQHYMSLALQLAQQGRYTVSPNPMVGCVLVKDNHIIGQGWHQRAGEPHAEILALRGIEDQAKGATAYVTLEPCCHFGKTSPCTSTLIRVGIKKVVIACLDPNPLVAGKGKAELQAAGIEVETGILEREAQQLNEIFFHYIQYKRPFIIAKWAMSLDGKTMPHPEDSPHISGKECHQNTHHLRQMVDAILVGSKTAIIDNPQLTARSDVHEVAKQPTRVILSSSGSLPAALKIVDGSLPGKTIIATTDARHAILTAKNVEVLVLPKNELGLVHLPSLLEELGKRAITSLLIEGGMTVHASFFNENVVNKIQVYVVPVIIGSLKKKKSIVDIACSRMGHDFCFTADY